MRIGLLGTGQHYVQAAQVLEDLEIVHRPVASGDDNAQHALQSLLDEQLDGLIVGAQVGPYVQVIQQAIEPMPHILWDVPPTVTAEEIQTLCQVGQRENSFVQPALAYRYLPVLKSLKQMLQEDRLGQILSIKISYPAKRPPTEPEVDVVAVRGLACIDLLRWLTGDEIRQVYLAMATSQADMQVFDLALLSVTLNRGAYAVLDIGWSLPAVYPASERLKLEIVGQTGNIRVDAFHQNLSLYHSRVEWASWGSDPTVELLRAFRECILSGQAPEVDCQQAYQAYQVIRAAYLSARKGVPVTTGLSRY